MSGLGITVSGQADEALRSVLLGVGAGLLYDTLRIVRKRVRLKIITPLSDGIFWITCAFALFALGLDAGEGKQRIFMTVLAFIGAASYFALLSRAVLWAYDFLSEGAVFLFRCASWPVRKALFFLKKTCYFVKKSFHPV